MHGKSVLRMIAGCLLAVAIMGAFVPEVKAIDIGGFKARANARGAARVARAQGGVGVQFVGPRFVVGQQVLIRQPRVIVQQGRAIVVDDCHGGFGASAEFFERSF
jgi:hypothetical protein